MRSAPLRRLLLVSALCASAGGLVACGGDEIATDVKPKTTPALTSPTGEGLAAGAGDQASQVTDLPTQTTTSTGPLPASGDSSDQGATDTGSSDSSSSDTGATDSGTSDPSSGSTSTSGSGTSAGNGGTGGTSTPSGGGTSSGSGSSGSSGTGSGSSSGSGTSTSGGGSSSSGGSTPSEFGEFCDTNPGVCR